VRILIHGLNFAPELVGVGKYTGEMAEWLAGRGHEVRAVTAPPFNPAWKVARGFSSWRYSREVCLRAEGGLTVLRCPLWVPQRPSTAKRILHLASFAFASALVMLRQISWKPEVVLVVEPTLFCLPAALITGRFCQAKTWLHVQDFEADAAFELGLAQSMALRSAIQWIEKKSMAAFDRVSTISEKMLGKLVGKGVERSDCCLFPNWVDTSAIFPLAEPSPLRAELGISRHEVVALYAGTMGRKQGLEMLGEAACRLERCEGLRFVFCGEGPGKSILAGVTNKLTNVQWIPLQPLNRLNHLLNLADLHLLPQKADAADLVMPSKLTGMLASGRPVVAASRPGTQLAEVVEGCGVVVAPDDAQAFARGIEQLAEDRRLREKLGARAREYALAELGKESVLSHLEQELLVLAAAS
jgi:colanic acid biosynthesis glycosyl transferase WcaI